MSFPTDRPRRLRRSPLIRDMVRETRLHRDQLIYPLFVVPGTGIKTEIKGFEGVYHHSVDRLVDTCRHAAGELGLKAVLLFGIPEAKDPEGSGAWVEDGIVQQACRALKKANVKLEIITDVCLCEYTSHGHCGVFRPTDGPPGETPHPRTRSGGDGAVSRQPTFARTSDSRSTSSSSPSTVISVPPYLE